jgi:hypothetical protein
MWDELGMAPCDDPKVIRRAYAARLKKLDPDRDPEAFTRLRAAFERALNETRQNGDRRSPAVSEPASPQHDADAATGPEPDGATVEHTAASPAASTQPGRGIPDADFQSWAATTDHDDIRDQALIVALDGALRRHDAAEATALFYRAAATGALSLDSAPGVIAHLLTVAVDDMTLDAAAFRRLARTVGVDTPQSRVPLDPALRARVLALLAAEDWYDDLSAKAKRKWRQGRTARRQGKIARLLLGRIGRYWHPRVDKTALRSWIAQYKIHKAWLGNRIDPAWISKLERRLRRREIFWLVCFILFVGSMLSQFVFLSIVAIMEGTTDDPLWALWAGPFLVLFFLWILKLLLVQLLNLSFPGWSESAAVVRLRAWARKGRALWNRLRGRKSGNAE